MTTTIRRWGNSLGLRISKALAEDAHLEDGTPVDIRVEKGRLVVARGKARKPTLDALLSRVAARNLHPEVSTGRPVGKESW